MSYVELKVKETFPTFRVRIPSRGGVFLGVTYKLRALIKSSIRPVLLMTEVSP